MNWMFITISTGIAAFIGGVTNHLAIKMLFHPRTAWHIGNWKVPFTPGLIPKRKTQIARSLGEVVGEYLVTSEGLKKVLNKPEFREKLQDKANAAILDWTSKEETLEEIALCYWTPEQVSHARRRLEEGLRTLTRRGAEYVWKDNELRRITLAQLIPRWQEERKHEWAAIGVRYITNAIRQELHSPNGSRMLGHLTSQLMEKAGGFLGALAGIFMDGDKLTAKLKMAISEQLESPAVTGMLSDLLVQKLTEMEAKTLGDLFEWASGEEGLDGVAERLNTSLRWENKLDTLAKTSCADLLGGYREALLEFSPRLIGGVIRLLESGMERIINTVQLPKLVEDQVGEFPIERLEQVILSVSGKEFRAITWLGVLLGGIIGLVQSVFMSIYMQ